MKDRPKAGANSRSRPLCTSNLQTRDFVCVCAQALERVDSVFSEIKQLYQMSIHLACFFCKGWSFSDCLSLKKRRLQELFLMLITLVGCDEVA